MSPQPRVRALPWVTTVARVVLGGVLLVAGVIKARDLDGSVTAVVAYQLVDYPVARVIGLALPVVEIALGKR